MKNLLSYIFGFFLILVFSSCEKNGKMVKNAHDNGYPTSNIYLMMLSSTVNYMLRFTGNVSNINLNFDPDTLKTVYKESFKKYSDEKAFLMFLKNEIPS